MRPGKLENLVSSGFCFLRECGENAAIFENKFTGLWLEFHFDNTDEEIAEHIAYHLNSVAYSLQQRDRRCKGECTYYLNGECH